MSRKSKAAEFVDEEYSLNITGRNVEVTNAMREYTIEKLSKIEKYGLRIVDVSITMETQKLLHRADMKVKVDHIVIKSHAETENMYASIDMAIDKLQRQISKYHSRIRDHHVKKAATVEMNVNVLKPLDEVNGEIEEVSRQKLVEQYRSHEIVKKESLTLKTLNYDEAIMKMDLSGHPFLVFKNEEDRKIKIIYRRTDGNYGVIEPEA